MDDFESKNEDFTKMLERNIRRLQAMIALVTYDNDGSGDGLPEPEGAN